jgi:plasmid stabilization system protein ParE
MALIQWQRKAKHHLKALFDYYRDAASDSIAISLRDTIVGEVESLEQFPEMGQVDEELSTSDARYQFLIVKWSKRTYRVYYLHESGRCYIVAIWDCSMNPKKRKARVVTRQRRP